MEKVTRIFIKDLPEEKRNELIKKNSKLINQLQSDLYESNLEMQYIDSKNIMNDEALKAIEYHNNYSSFFYTLINWRKFIENIDRDYLSADVLDTYKEINDGIEKLDTFDVYDDNYYDLDAKLEEKTKIILKDVENYLHNYEEYPDEDDAIQYADEMEQLNEYYIEQREDGTSDGVIRKDVSYTECYI